MQHQPKYHCRVHHSQRSSKDKRHESSFKFGKSQPATSNCIQKCIARSNISIYLDQTMWYKRCSDKKNRPTKELLKPFRAVPVGSNLQKPIRPTDPKGAEYRTQKALPPLPHQTQTTLPQQQQQQQQPVHADPVHVDFCHFSSLGDFERLHTKQSAAKLARVLGVPVTRTGHHFRPRVQLDIPATLEEHPALSDSSNDSVEEFANICTFSPFGMSFQNVGNKGLPDDRQPNLRLQDTSLGAHGQQVQDSYTWKKLAYEHEDVTSRIDFERDSFTTLASLDRVWENPSVSGDSWTDDVLDHFTNILSLDDEDTLVFFDGPFDDNYDQVTGDPILGKS